MDAKDGREMPPMHQDTDEQEGGERTAPSSTIPTRGVSMPMDPWKLIAGGGLAGVVAAIVLIWQMLTGTAQERAALEVRLTRIEDKLAVLVEDNKTSRPTVAERDFSRWVGAMRRDNPTLKVPEYDPEY